MARAVIMERAGFRKLVVGDEADLAACRARADAVFAKARAESRHPTREEFDDLERQARGLQPLQMTAPPQSFAKAELPSVDFETRKAATREAVDALAQARSRSEGITYAKAYDRVAVELSRELGPYLI